MAGHYASPEASFDLFESPISPPWRHPQRGALGALLAHWSIPRRAPALVSIPTGSGKSAIATAAPYLVQARRVLVVVPSKDLRTQLGRDFATEGDLRRIGARQGETCPVVHFVTGRVAAWAPLENADVVIGLPQSISPVHYQDDPPSSDMFDLVIVDEAHHAPAPTWKAILDHFSGARSLLLTATPQRRDGKRVPGDLIYHYPLRQALDDGIYKPVRPVVLDLGASPTKAHTDDVIADEVARLASTPEHATSSILIRTATVARARDVAALYEQRGLPVVTLSTHTSPTRRSQIVDGLRSGEIRAVAVVDMLGEGFDLPSLRIAGYHDKHKSANATVQLIGRLARSSSTHPQDSVIVTGLDTDVYPQLQGVVRTLWEEDADWATVLPGLIDQEVADSLADREYAALFSRVPPELSIESVHPILRAVLYEVDDKAWEPGFLQEMPEALEVGQRLGGQEILFCATTPSNMALIVVTTSIDRPKWHSDSGLDSLRFELHLLTWHPATRTDQKGLLTINTADRRMISELLSALDAADKARVADPKRLQDAFDSLDRISVSNVGVRNTYLGTRGVPSYKTFAGSGVERGLRDADTGRSALGHAMAQVTGENGTFTAGIATAKGKIWESRYVRLRDYENHIADYVARYWIPPLGGPGRLLPGVSRGERLVGFPDSLVVAVELDPAAYGSGWIVANNVPLDNLDLRAEQPTTHTPTTLAIAAFDGTDSDQPIWRGMQDADGRFHPTTEATMRRGFGTPDTLSRYLTLRPPSIYFGNGQTIVGGLTYAPAEVRRELPTSIDYVNSAWLDVDLKAETKQRARVNGKGISIHEALEQWLIARPPRRRHRWIFCNDGSREMADYIVVEAGSGTGVRLGLWHAKAAGEPLPSVRLGDMQTVIAQAIKSRRWATDRGVWAELEARLSGRSSPQLTMIEGRPRLFDILCGRVPGHPVYSLPRHTPMVEFELGIAQPGLSLDLLRTQLDQVPLPVPAQQICELLTVWHDAAGTVGNLTLLTTV